MRPIGEPILVASPLLPRPRQNLLRSDFFLTVGSPATCRTAPRTGFAEGAIRRCSRPPNDHQKNVENKKSNCDVVEHCCLRQIRPELIRGPEKKCNSKQDRLQKLHRARPMRNLVDQVRNSDRGQRESRQYLVTSGRKSPRSNIPGQQSCNARKRDRPQSGSKESFASDKTRVHRK
jgi:hypothetical protein